MEITLENILNEIDYFKPQLYFKKKDILIKSVKFINSSENIFEPDILYIGDLKYVNSIYILNTSINLLCTDECKLLHRFLKYQKLNLILFNNSKELASIFNIVQDIFIKKDMYRLGRAKLSELYLDDCSIQQLIDCSFEVLQNPICLSDNNNDIMAYTENIIIEDQTWIEMIEQRALPNRCFNTLQSKRIIEKIRMKKEPIITPLPYSKYRNVLNIIVIDGKLIAHIGIVESMRPIEDEDISFISFLCKIISALLEKNNLTKNRKKIMFENFLIKLLEGKINNVETIEEECKHFHMSYNENTLIVSIVIDELEIKNTNLSYIRDQLENIIGSTNSIIYAGHIVFIITGENHNLLNKIIVERLKEFLTNNKMYAGVSRNFRNLKDSDKFYQQSISSIELGLIVNKKELIYKYEDYAVYDILKNFKKEKMKEYCHPSIYRLIEYDNNNKTVFSKTLYEYLNNSKNMTKTALCLNIHRNSLHYRIVKICEIANISLDNNNEVFHIQLSFKILEFLGEIHF